MTYVISTDASLSRLWPITRHAALVMPLGAPQSTVASLDAQSLCSSKNETIRSYICASTTYELPIAKKKIRLPPRAGPRSRHPAIVLHSPPHPHLNLPSIQSCRLLPSHIIRRQTSRDDSLNPSVLCPHCSLQRGPIGGEVAAFWILILGTIGDQKGAHLTSKSFYPAPKTKLLGFYFLVTVGDASL
jgi:hypothetical protein